LFGLTRHDRQMGLAGHASPVGSAGKFIRRQAAARFTPTSVPADRTGAPWRRRA